MTKNEFIAYCREYSDSFDEPTDKEYEIIELVYTFHPCITSEHGKKQIARLYTEYGMILIKDMVNTADAAKNLERQIQIHRNLRAKYQEELDNLKAGK